MDWNSDMWSEVHTVLCATQDTHRKELTLLLLTTDAEKKRLRNFMIKFNQQSIYKQDVLLVVGD